MLVYKQFFLALMIASAMAIVEVQSTTVSDRPPVILRVASLPRMDSLRNMRKRRRRRVRILRTI